MIFGVQIFEHFSIKKWYIVRNDVQLGDGVGKLLEACVGGYYGLIPDKQIARKCEVPPYHGGYALPLPGCWPVCMVPGWCPDSASATLPLLAVAVV